MQKLEREQASGRWSGWRKKVEEEKVAALIGDVQAGCIDLHGN